MTRVIAVLEPGGAQLGLLRVALALRQQGVETQVLAGYATRSGLDLFRSRGLEVNVWGLDPAMQYACSDEFARWLKPRLRGAEVVHAHMFGGWWAAAEAVPDEAPLVASEHNAFQWPKLPRLAEMRRALARVDLFFAHGPESRRAVLEAGLRPDRLRQGVSAVELPTPAADDSLPQPRIVFAGRLHAEKGPDLLLEALGRLSRPPSTLVLGIGPMEEDLKARAARLGLDARVRFLGWREDPERFIVGASACVAPSRYDAWSQTGVLAMGLGVPVIGTAVEGLPSLLAGGRGILIRPEDPTSLAAAIDAVVSGRRRPDRDAARRYARRFTPERAAAIYHAHYRQLAGSRPLRALEAVQG